MKLLPYSLLVAVSYRAAAVSAAQWSTAQQLAVGDVSAVVVSPDQMWVAVLAPTLTLHNLAEGGDVADGGASAGNAVVSFCNRTGIACTQPTFSMGSTPLGLGLIANKSLFVSHFVAKEWTPPRMVQTGNEAPIFFAWSSKGDEIAYSSAVQLAHSPTEPRVLMDDVIIDVIMAGPTVVRNQLCFTAVTDDGVQQTSTPPECVPAGPSGLASVGMSGWTISCWPFDSHFAYSPALTGPTAGLIAVTTTNTTKANDWVSLGVHLYDTKTHKVRPVATATAFQPLFSPDGSKLAFTIADDKDYVWSQTWKICILDIAQALGQTGVSDDISAATKCDTGGTLDQMPTLVGWGDGGASIYYTEQNGTAIQLFAMDAASLHGDMSAPWSTSSASAKGWRSIGPLGGANAAWGGVLGGGFRDTSRVSVATSKSTG